MKKTIFLFVLSAVMLFGCSGNDKKTTDNDTTTQNTSGDDIQKESIISTPDSVVIEMDIKDGKGIVETCKNKDQTIYIQFESEDYRKISAHLSSTDSTANIRFSQIFLPDGSADGPFGRDMEYNLSIKGLYTISVNENMMAGDPWEGPFEVEIELTR